MARIALLPITIGGHQFLAQAVAVTDGDLRVDLIFHSEEGARAADEAIRLGTNARLDIACAGIGLVPACSLALRRYTIPEEHVEIVDERFREILGLRRVYWTLSMWFSPPPGFAMEVPDVMTGASHTAFVAGRG